MPVILVPPSTSAGPLPPSSTTDAVVATVIADEAVGGGRVVRLTPNAIYASSEDVNTVEGAFGVTFGAAGEGDLVSVLLYGEMVDPAWSWVPDRYLFLGANGLMTQTPPEAPSYLRAIGVAIDSNTIFVKPKPPIALV